MIAANIERMVDRLLIEPVGFDAACTLEHAAWRACQIDQRAAEPPVEARID
jgi:hypothetical protein